MTNITEVPAPTNAGCRSTELSEHNRIPKVWHLFSGVVIADLSILLIGLGGWDVLKNDARILIYVSGSILLLCGLFLIVYHRCAPVQLPAQLSQGAQ